MIRAPTSRRHCRMSRACGIVTVNKGKKRAGKDVQNPYFWTMMFDPDTMDVLTDGPVTTLVAPGSCDNNENTKEE